MNDDQSAELARKQFMDMQAMLIKLRDGLLNLSASLQELALVSDDEAMQVARVETEQLLSRLRG
ncbi:MAG: hypothetical protein KGI91_06545 [Burkholderiales bacterium]|nr:hypothetical protein [Burkholderiales bacterium]MDE2076720.1 hypothetical protein [Burkholderiales bacterium]MDE2431324.1 hypothetical protein [Burkholderiales bacterium]HET8693240.1 hypothetical protein [Aquabacterium sp.]